MATEAKKEAQKFKPIEKDVFLGVVEDFENKKQKKDDAQMNFAAFYKQKEEEVGLHRTAFKDVMKLKAMSVEKRQDYLRAQKQYLDHLKLNLTNDMVDVAEAGADAEENRPVVAAA